MAARTGKAPAQEPADPVRLGVPRTAKMLIGGAFVRSESGRVHPHPDHAGVFAANVPSGSRKDARDAVRAARAGFGVWSSMTGYNRGQVLYRLAEMVQGRRDQLAGEVAAALGGDLQAGRAHVDQAVDRLVWYAGWCDKLGQVLGSVNPVSGPFSSVSEPVGSGVVAAIAPAGSPLLGLVSVVAPALAAGSSVIVLAAEDAELVAVTFAEAVCTADVPAGTVNVLTGSAHDMLEALAAHADVNVLDLAGLDDELLAARAEELAAGTLKRVRRPLHGRWWALEPGLAGMRLSTETRTTWGTTGR